MHRTGLWKNRYNTIKYPTGYNVGDLNPEARQFIDRNEARQEKARRALSSNGDGRALTTNYKLMQVWDLLGLYFCCHDPSDDYIEPVPVGYSDDREVRLRMKPAGSGVVLFEPFPFDTRPCHVQLTFKRLPQASFESLQAFHRAYFQAAIDVMRFELR